MKILFGDRLKELRIERKISQTELAEQFETGKSTISNYEHNNRLPDVNTISKFAEYFDVSLDYIMGKTDNRKNDSITVNPPDYIEKVLPQNIVIDSQTKKLFIERVKFRMIDEELTKETLAIKSGVKKELISKYLNAKLLPDIKTLKKLASALNTTSDYLLGLNVNPSPNEINILENWVIIRDGENVKKVSADAIRDFLNSVSDDENEE